MYFALIRCVRMEKNVYRGIFGRRLPLLDIRISNTAPTTAGSIRFGIKRFIRFEATAAIYDSNVRLGRRRLG